MLEKQVKALRFIESYTTITGRCPSIREVIALVLLPLPL